MWQSYHARIPDLYAAIVFATFSISGTAEKIDTLLAQHMSEQQLNAYYLTCLDTASCKKLMDRYGVVVISPDNIKDYLQVLYDQGEAVSKHEQRSWNYFLTRIAVE